MVALLLLISLVAATGVLAYARGRTLPAGSILGSAQAALRTVGDTSQDAALSAKVKMALALSKYVSAFDIHVAARAGDITLTGQVPTEEIREMAEAIAADTAGVTQVVNRVTVDPSLRADDLRKDLAQRVGDLEIHTLTVRALVAIPDVNAGGIDVRVDRGTVFLNGIVDTIGQRDHVDRAVATIDGVVRVVNNLAVKTPSATIDTAEQALARRVEFNLWKTRAFDLAQIQLDVASHTVTLGGSTRSMAEKLLAERIARETDGAHEVVNNLTVPSDALHLEPSR